TTKEIIEVILGDDTTFTSNGSDMVELVANSTDAAGEKHVPVITVDGNKVHVVVGSVIHPMSEEHSIQFIALETKNGVQRKALNPTDKPEATFVLNEGDEVVAAYEFCNLHGLWKATL
ncbi:MAG: desulfoferrodoxin family protein, partial [Bulleidia sp.]|nr:desulfoferrodoxin family protein [Bulleidia sp.]